MPFAPAIPYQAPQLLEQGILSGAQTFNQDLMKALQKYEEDKKQREFNTGMFDSLKNDPNTAKYIPTDALQKWDSMNGDKQAGVLAGVARRSTAEQQQQKLQIDQAQADYYRAHADYMRARAGAEGADEGTPFLPVTDATGKQIPGQIYVKKTGAIHDVSDAGNTPLIDASGKFFLDRKTNAWKPLPPATMILTGINQPGGAGGAPAAAPTFNVQPSGAQPTAPVAPPQAGAKPLDPATAQQFLQQAGGDKDKARDLARAAGYTF
jgi:hypothetical protein